MTKMRGFYVNGSLTDLTGCQMFSPAQPTFLPLPAHLGKRIPTEFCTFAVIRPSRIVRPAVDLRPQVRECLFLLPTRFFVFFFGHIYAFIVALAFFITHFDQLLDRTALLVAQSVVLSHARYTCKKKMNLKAAQYVFSAPSKLHSTSNFYVVERSSFQVSVIAYTSA